MKWIVTGGCGFIGTNATRQLAESDDEVVVIDNLSRPMVHRNLRYLRDTFNVECHVPSIRDAGELEHVVRTHSDADAVLHLAGQVSLLASIEDPRFNFEANALGTLNVLEAVRTSAPVHRTGDRTGSVDALRGLPQWRHRMVDRRYRGSFQRK